ncbi:hypothetical protein ACQ3I4_08990 [Zafaria sp. Z1313]|uniref:hypothetical protein n=1 Tax=unclassified Zafaria TaxID=2828765 RepID=UPI002E75BD9F|nr:hypothetical protein [Zafaria sp. J156]MEE1621662.1 hypothetical protein [Zafaria sp. J156]
MKNSTKQRTRPGKWTGPAAIGSWVSAAAALALMAWIGLTSSAAAVVDDAAAAGRLELLWRVQGGAAALLLLMWIPFAFHRRMLPVVATGICAVGAMAAVAGLAFFRELDTVWIHGAAAVVLGLGALVQLAVRFPDVPGGRAGVGRWPS